MMEERRGALTGVVTVISTGGTIANTVSGRVPIEEVLVSLPESEQLRIGETRIREVTRDGSDAFVPDHWLAIARAIDEETRRDDCIGVVVTHGTYTVEESAYFAHLSVPTMKPIVFTCSQRQHGLLGNDGDRNLVDAVLVARAPGAVGKGALLAIHEEIHSARDVAKTNQRPGGFASLGYGLLGSIEADQVSLYRSPERRHTYRSDFRIPNGPLPRVDIVSAYPGADGVGIDAFVDAGARGIVLHGMAYAGRPHPDQYEALERAIGAGVTIVVANRGLQGRVPANDPLLRDFVAGDSLSAQKARVLLMVGLAHGLDDTGLRSAFASY
jgi:L-asparaginase/Glu-tRNA(Gln) amidotransferase subunit D